MQVKIVYRNYKPLHDLYTSFEIEPPEGISFIIPRPRQSLRYLVPIYKKFGDIPLVRFVIAKGQELVFNKHNDDADLYHFTQQISLRIPVKPYVVDFEHVTSLANFVKMDAPAIQQVLHFLNHSRCYGIMPLSKAAETSLKYLLEDQSLDQILEKLEVVYPALPDYQALFGDQVDFSYVSSASDVFRLLFVGNDAYRKGLHELLAAFEYLEGKYDDVELYVVSDVPVHLRKRYQSDRLKYYAPKFSRSDIIKKFYLTCDLFVMPTHADTLGMAFLFALACGMPVVTTKQFATPEIIRPGHNGLFVDSKRLYLNNVPFPSRETRDIFDQDKTEEKILVDDLIDKIEYLYLNRSTLTEMSRQTVKDFESGGKFSIDVRNDKLLRVYKSFSER